MREDYHGPSEGGRVTRTINAQWLFCYDPEERLNERRAKARHDEKNFYGVALPHTWHTYETTGQVHPFIRNPSESDNPYWWYGWGWYRKRVRIGGRHRGRRVFVEFDAVQKYTRVYCNGAFVGDHKGGFASFSKEITDHVNWGGETVLAVAVSARRDDLFGNIPPMTAGNWDVYGGIYRDARVVIKNAVHIPFQGSAEHEGGTFVTTPEVSRSRARARIVTHVRNAGGAVRRVHVVNRILDANHREIALMESSVRIPAGKQIAVAQDSPFIRRPRLWSPDDPYLYQVDTKIVAADSGGADGQGEKSVKGQKGQTGQAGRTGRTGRKGGEVLDTYRSSLGFRWFHWDHDKDLLYLNGKRFHIHGSNRHEEYPWLGNAVPEWIHEKDLDDFRHNLNHNFARFAHYPHGPFVYDYCDRHGILVCEETPCIKSLPFGREAQRQQVVEMVRRDRNHPCVILWSMGNETNNWADERWALAEDASRLIFYRHCYGLDPTGKLTHRNLGLESLLRCTARGWPERDAMDPAAAPLPEDHPHGQVTGTEEWQHRMACKRGGSIRGSIRGHIGKNICTWLYADHGADREYRGCPLKHVNPKGWVDLYRQPKYMYYLWQANYGKRLMVFAHPHWWRRKYLGQRHDIVVDSNGATVSLYVGGRLIGRKRPHPRRFCSVTFPGVKVVDKTLRVVAGRGDEVYEQAVLMAGEPFALALSASSETIHADRSGVALVTADIVDARGQHVQGAANAIRWSVRGPGRLAAPARFTSDTNKREAFEGTMYITPPVVIPVRSTNVPGVIRVRASSPGLRPASAVIHSQAPSPASDDGIEEPPAHDGNHERLARQQKEGKRGNVTGRTPLATVYGDVRLGGGDKEAMRRALRARFGLNKLDQRKEAGRALLDLLTQQAVAGNGTIIADDYNLHVGQFNALLRKSR